MGGRFKHGEAFRGRQSVEWTAWQNMIKRCYYPGDTSYFRYGAKGVTVCDEWRGSFQAFLRDVGRRPGPSSQYSLDRIDNSKGYEPGNVHWATRAWQSLNQKNNILRDINDERVSVRKCAEYLAIPYQVLRYRLKPYMGKPRWV